MDNTNKFECGFSPDILNMITKHLFAGEIKEYQEVQPEELVYTYGTASLATCLKVDKMDKRRAIINQAFQHHGIYRPKQLFRFLRNMVETSRSVATSDPFSAFSTNETSMMTAWDAIMKYIEIKIHPLLDKWKTELALTGERRESELYSRLHSAEIDWILQTARLQQNSSNRSPIVFRRSKTYCSMSMVNKKWYAMMKSVSIPIHVWIQGLDAPEKSALALLHGSMHSPRGYFAFLPRLNASVHVTLKNQRLSKTFNMQGIATKVKSITVGADNNGSTPWNVDFERLFWHCGQNLIKLRYHSLNWPPKNDSSLSVLRHAKECELTKDESIHKLLSLLKGRSENTIQLVKQRLENHWPSQLTNKSIIPLLLDVGYETRRSKGYARDYIDEGLNWRLEAVYQIDKVVYRLPFLNSDNLEFPYFIGHIASALPAFLPKADLLVLTSCCVANKDFFKGEGMAQIYDTPNSIPKGYMAVEDIKKVKLDDVRIVNLKALLKWLSGLEIIVTTKKTRGKRKMKTDMLHINSERRRGVLPGMPIEIVAENYKPMI